MHSEAIVIFATSSTVCDNDKTVYSKLQAILLQHFYIAKSKPQLLE